MAGLFATLTSAQAAEPVATAPGDKTEASVAAASTLPSTWSGDAELGVVLTRGNSTTSNTNARVKVENDREHWRNRFSAAYLDASDSGDTTAQRYVADFNANYKFRPLDYVVMTLRYENDRFAGFKYRVSETLGYGRRLIDTETSRLEGELGAGGRHTKFLDGTRDNEGIVRVALKYARKISSTSEFREEAFSEIGVNNTHSESNTSLKVKVNASLAMKLNVLVTHDSTVPVGKLKTDTKTSVNMVYDF